MIDLRRFFEAFDGNPHQIAAIEMLQQAMPEELLSLEHEWVDCYQVECEIINTVPYRSKKEWQ